MGSKKLTITEGLDLANDASITRADLVYWFTQSLFGDVDRDHFATGTNPVVSSATAPSAPATGLGWFDTDTGVVSFWSGSEWIASVVYSATAPSGTGTLWYDTTLQLLRRYETRDAIAGWHPLDVAYQLMHNRSGGTVAANLVAIKSTAGTSNREFTTTVAVKDQGVIGVLLEETNDAAAGVVALVSGGAVVDVLADDAAADGAIAKGDLLVTYTVAGECRTVGPAPSGFTGSGFSFRTMGGVPVGAFAEALGGKDATTHLVRCRMLGSVGTGSTIRGELVSIVASLTEGADTEVDFSGSEYNAKHLPIIGFQAYVNLSDDGGAAGTDVHLQLQFKPGGAATVARVNLEHRGAGQGSANGGTPGIVQHAWNDVFVVTNDGLAGGYDGVGSLFTYNLTAGVAYDTKQLGHIGYIY